MMMGENHNLCLSAFDNIVEKIAELLMDITKKSFIKVDVKFSNGVSSAMVLFILLISSD